MKGFQNRNPSKMLPSLVLSMQVSRWIILPRSRRLKAARNFLATDKSVEYVVFLLLIRCHIL
jgi:hypothetical protein